MYTVRRFIHCNSNHFVSRIGQHAFPTWYQISFLLSSLELSNMGWALEHLSSQQLCAILSHVAITLRNNFKFISLVTSFTSLSSFLSRLLIFPVADYLGLLKSMLCTEARTSMSSPVDSRSIWASHSQLSSVVTFSTSYRLSKS